MQPWPRRSPQAVQALRPGETVQGGGRTFHRAPLPDDLYDHLKQIEAAHAVLPVPDYVGHVMGLPPAKPIT